MLEKSFDECFNYFIGLKESETSFKISKEIYFEFKKDYKNLRRKRRLVEILNNLMQNMEQNKRTILALWYIRTFHVLKPEESWDIVDFDVFYIHLQVISLILQAKEIGENNVSGREYENWLKDYWLFLKSYLIYSI